MLMYVIDKTKKYLDDMPKAERKKIGQFFTSLETAEFMADMFDLRKTSSNAVSILDPGAGSGILSAALLERIVTEKVFSKVRLVCYENNEDVLPILYSNLDYMAEQIKQNTTLIFEYEVRTKDYILSQQHDFQEDLFADKNPEKYDLIIGNPPYMRVLRDHPAALAMPSIVHGAPNLYFIFAALSLFNLKENAQMVYIIPRSWTSGAYFEAFRNYLLEVGKIDQLHLFISRDKVFEQEQVLQETMIIKIIKSSATPEKVLITSSQSNHDFSNVTRLEVPYDTVVCGSSNYVYLPTSEEDMLTIQTINRYSDTLPALGYKMKTGIVVDFRQWDELRTEPGNHIIPLFYSQHIRNGRVNHEPSGKNYDWMVDSVPGLIQRNKNYVFCKRFTAKEERRRLQCGIYLSADFSEYSCIGTQNKINFVDRIDKMDMEPEMVFGIYGLLNSTLFDQYYRILNGSTQVNSTEINSIPVPPTEIIGQIGKLIISGHDLSTPACDKILKEVAYE